MMPTTLIIQLSIIFFFIAMIYSSVGHAGASGYLATMILLGVAPSVMRPTALLLNIVVSLLVVTHLWRHKLIDWRHLSPLLLGSIPTAYWAASLKLSDQVYFHILAVVMIASAILLFLRTYQTQTYEAQTNPTLHPFVAVIIGAAIGLLSGLTGTGGGIFLSPLLILLCGFGVRRTAALSAPFILFNSISGLTGLWHALPNLSVTSIWLILSVAIGGIIGARLSTHILPIRSLLRILSAVMILSATKLLISA